MVDRAVVVRLLVDPKQYIAGITQASAATQAFAAKTAATSATAAKSVKSMGAEAGLLGSKFNTPMLAAGAALAYTAKQAIDWDTAWTGVTKTVDGSPEQMASLEKELRQLATTLPATHAEIAGVAEAAGQLGVERENIAEFTKTMIDLGETTNLSADEAATTLARFSNIMGTSQDEVDNLGSAIVELGNNYETTEAEIANMALRIAGAGAQAGLTEGDVLGLATALSSVGIEAEAGGTAISRVMIDIGKSVDSGSDSVQTLARVAGMSASEFSTAWRDDAGGALTAFIEGLGRVAEAGGPVNGILEELGFTDIRVGDALRRASANASGFAEALRTGNEAYVENSALAEEAQKRYDTLAARIDVAKNRIADAAIEIGGPVAEGFADIAEVVGSVAKGFNDLNDAIKETNTGPVNELAGGEGWDLTYNIGDLARDTADSFQYWKIALTESTEAADEWWEVVRNGNGALAETSTEAERSTDAVEGVGAASQGTADDFADMGGEAMSAAEQIEELADVIRDQGKTFRDSSEANDNYTLSLKDARQRFREFAEEGNAGMLTLEGNSRAAIENRDVMRGLAERALEAAASMATLDGDTAGAERRIRNARTQFVNLAMDLGLSRTEARKLARQMGLVEGNYEVAVETPGLPEAQSRVDTLARQLAELPRQKWITVSVNTNYTQTGLVNKFNSGMMPGFNADGGFIRGPGGPRDDAIPSWLSNGEYVLSAAAVARLGIPYLDALNSGRMYGFAQGGYVGRRTGSPESVTNSETINIGQVVAHDYNDFRTQMERERRVSALPGASR